MKTFHSARCAKRWRGRRKLCRYLLGPCHVVEDSKLTNILKTIKYHYKTRDVEKAEKGTGLRSLRQLEGKQVLELRGITMCQVQHSTD